MVSSHDVAKLAGVSQATVSRVLNGSTLVKKDTVEKVERAMKELNFRPNLIARSLVKNKTNTLALITEHLHNPFYVESTRRIVKIAAKHGYNVLVFFHQIGDGTRLYEQVLSNKVDGIIMSSILIDDPIYQVLESLQDIPYVTFNRKHRLGMNYVELDNVHATSLSVDHVVSLGHKKIAYMGGSLLASTFYGRLQGFYQAISRHKIHIKDSWIKMTDTSSMSIKEACKELIEDADQPTAIIAATDAIAMTCLDYLLAYGYRVPEDISLTGIDNIDITSHHSIQLTTVGIKLEESMGELAIERLIEMIEQEDLRTSPVQITLEPCLMQRKTTGHIE